MAEEKEKAVVTAEEQVLEQPSLIEEIIQATDLKPKPTEESHKIMERGLKELLGKILEPGREAVKISRAVVDDMIGEIDKKISRQLDEILHNQEYQKLESAWRSLKFLVERTNFRENIKIEILNVSKDDLHEDIDSHMDIVKRGLYQIVYRKEYGQFGGKPYGAMIGNYEFGAGPQDMSLLQYVASVSAMAHAPFITAASPAFFGQVDYTTLPFLKDIKAIMEAPQYIKWQSFRESEDARYVGLTLPRFLIRLPYGPKTQPVKAFNYEEDVSASHAHYLWGNSAFALASKLTDSFAKYRWCANIIGPQSGGAVEDLLLHQYEAMGGIQTKIPTEVLIPERLEYELAEEGFIALTMRKGSDNAAFFSANSAQKPKVFPDTEKGRQAKTNFILGTQLPYMFIINRLAHYLKVLQREYIGSWKERVDLERELNEWIRQYIADQENPSPAVRSRRPLRQARVAVEDVEGDPGWYRVRLEVRPHFKYMGAFFTLSLVGKLDKK